MHSGKTRLTLCVLVLAIAVLFSGCSAPKKLSPETSFLKAQLTTPPSNFTYSLTLSAPLLQISGGNLHWHKSLPADDFTLEDLAIEVLNYGDIDIFVARLGITVDNDTRTLAVDRLIPPGERINLVFRPMMAGYDGGMHYINVVLLDEGGGTLCQNAVESIGPLEPPAQVGWTPLAN